MGRLSKEVLGKNKLPSRCVIYAGPYVPKRVRVIRRYFDTWERVRGNWVRYTYASKDRKKYLVCFNVYGASMTLELLHLLREGKVTSVFFIGSMGSENLDVGTIVLPDTVVDRSGIVLLDAPNKSQVKVDRESNYDIQTALEKIDEPYLMGKTVSVPAVLHDIKAVKRFLSEAKDILGFELELSTFHYFGRKLGLKTFGLLYVEDNREHDIISSSTNLMKMRMRALRSATRVSLQIL